MEIFYKIIALLGGLAMFLYGMRVMGDGLKASSGGAMKNALAKVTNRPVLGFLLGVLVTCVIQSSTATIVLTVGLVGAGFLNFRQSVGIVLGANVGTAITAQIIRLMDIDAGNGSILYFFKADNLAPMALVLGIALVMFAKRGSFKNIGNTAAGFGILFMGLIFMSDAVSAFEEGLSGLLTAFENSFILQFLSGVGVTGVIQSSSAVIGIVQSVASSMGVTFSGVFAVIIGVNIGDCLTTFIVSRIGARPEQVRTATVHVIYNVFAALLISAAVIVLRKTGVLNDEIWNMSLNSGGVANVHGIFRLVPAIVFLPFSKVLAKISERIVKDTPVDDEDAAVEDAIKDLDPHLISSPVMALDQVRHLLENMSGVALHNYDACVKQIYEYDMDRYNRINQREDLLDRITDQTNIYLITLSQYMVRDRDVRRQNYYFKVLTVFERIGDLAINITKNMERLRNEDKSFSDLALEELRVAIDACYEILENTISAFIKSDADMARKIEPLEEVLDDLIVELNSRHIARMTNGECEVFCGIIYQDITTNLEHISDMCSDLAIYILELSDLNIQGREHEYIHNLHHSDNEDFHNAFNMYKDKYFRRLKYIS